MKKIVFVLFGCLIIFQSCSNVFYNHANKTEKVTVKVKPFKLINCLIQNHKL